MASRHAGNGPDHGALRRCRPRRIDRDGHRRTGAACRSAGPRALRLAHRRPAGSGRLRSYRVPPLAGVSRPEADRMNVARAKPHPPADLLVSGRPLTIARVADGAEGLVLADLARAIAVRPRAPATSLLVVCRDGSRMAQLSRALAFFAPDIGVLEFPAWDCQPYDRASPHSGLIAQRMTTLSRLAHLKEQAGAQSRPSVLLATVNAMVQRVPARALVAGQGLSAAPGNMLAMDGIVRWLELNGFMRASTVREAGEYAVRGGIIDLFPPGVYDPVRLDFFGDTLESIRSFDPETQRSTDQLRALDLVPVAEFQLTSETIRRFRTGYVQAFGAATPDDLLYEAVSEGRRYPGIEHWLPLFHDGLDTLFDYLPGTPVAMEPLAEDSAHERFAQIADYYDARRQDLAHGAEKASSGVAYKPLPPDRLYLGETEWRERLEAGKLVRLVPFAAPPPPYPPPHAGEGREGAAIDASTRQGRNFAPERAQPDANVFDAARAHANALQSAGKRVVFALWRDGARDRMSHVLADHAVL